MTNEHVGLVKEVVNKSKVAAALSSDVNRDNGEGKLMMKTGGAGSEGPWAAEGGGTGTLKIRKTRNGKTG